MTGPGEPAGRTVHVDTHLHTAASYDGRTVPETLLSRARAAGLDAIAVTDHDTVEGARVAADLAEDLPVIVGCEVSTADGHLLALGIDAAPEPGRPLVETARDVRACGGVAVVPHPFQRSRHGASRTAIDGVDGIEVYNAHALTNIRNRQATRFARAAGYPAFGGSDAHRPGGIGRAATAVTLRPGDPLTTDALLAAMRAGRTAAVRRSPSRSRYISKVVENATRKTLALL
ncbi:PHP domain-containing protein [Haloarcula sp. Atlit-7R]|uniref:CehA/McbA family metallohydrolase n=1 Tax=Haloarcula sp. Atlit-7R TaxID=2282125 RepID=UPI000EF130EA|nr:PHP domain-containing protein [Haloarcula sp. Atlit-7R]RLM96329.1 PHP domain-containing protein [Haloarcula sp. Atlit-7R]